MLTEAIYCGGDMQVVAGTTTTEDKAESKHETEEGYRMKLVDLERTNDCLLSLGLFRDT
jgi:hypothetical protein